MNVREFLDSHHVAYQAVPHRRTFDAQRLAEAVDESGHHVAKTVLLKSQSDYLLAVVPATHVVDLPGMQQILGSPLAVASEGEVTTQFSDCETGAIPPFGSWYGMKTLVDESFSAADMIVFEGNSHDEAIRMQFADYFELEKPLITRLSYPQT